MGLDSKKLETLVRDREITEAASKTGAYCLLGDHWRCWNARRGERA